MPLQMVQPTKHPRTGVYQLRLSIPAKTREVALQLYGVGREFTASLGTKDKREAIAAAPPVLATLQAKLQAVRSAHTNGPRSLTHLEVHAFAGDWYRENLATHQDNPGTFKAWEAHKDALLEPFECEPDEERPEFDPDEKALDEARTRLAAGHGIVATAQSVRAFAVALRSAQINHAERMMELTAGRYNPNKPDRVMEAFPVLPTGTKVAAVPPNRPGTSFDDLLRSWALDNGHDPNAKPIPRAYYDRARTIDRLAAFLGHNDAPKVAKLDVVAWKESMQSSGKAAATVRNDLSEMSAIWRAGAANGKVQDNPFAGTLPPKRKRGGKTRRPFTDAEVVTILTAARLQTRPVLRWLPWVLCLTGARTSEICQSTQDDITIIEGRPFIHIHDTPSEREDGEAQRSVKNEPSIRHVPIHPLLASEGFLTYVGKLPVGSPLFPDVKPDALFGSRGTEGVRIVRRWIRGKLKLEDKLISPNHSWRHWFIGRARRVGIPEEARHAMTGHVDGGNESHNYGDGWREMPAQLAEELGKITLPDGVICQKNLDPHPGSITPARTRRPRSAAMTVSPPR